jgi:hypothetical protein
VNADHFVQIPISQAFKEYIRALSSERTILSREDYCALGQVVSAKHSRCPPDHKFKVTDTQQIQLGKGVIIPVGEKLYHEGIYVVADGDWY